MMLPGRYDLNLYRGDSYEWQFHLFDDLLETIATDLTGALAASEIRDRPAGSNVTALTCLVLLPNVIEVVLAATQWSTIPARGVWDLQISFSADDVRTVLAGCVMVTTDVTESTPAVSTLLTPVL
jgi:hypothetical protein